MLLLKTSPWHSLHSTSVLRLVRCTPTGIHHQLHPARRGLLTLAIETSCDDTSVAILERNKHHHSKLHFHSTITADNRAFHGIHPLVALKSHQQSLAALLNAALEGLPIQDPAVAHLGNTVLIEGRDGAKIRKKPDFVAVTRGPGMTSSLNTGLDTAKGLAVAWRVPLLGINHMQAHALTPRLVSSLETDGDVGLGGPDPAFPYLSLLVSGGHTMVVHSRGLLDHEILVETMDIAVGDAIDKCARDVLPSAVLESSETVRYGQMLEEFAFPGGSQDYEYVPAVTIKDGWKPRSSDFGWTLRPPLSSSGPQRNLMEYSFSGTASAVKRIVEANPEISDAERRILARETMRLIFEHLASRLLMALTREGMDDVKTIVVSGGVASNQYLKYILRAILDQRGLEKIRLYFPPPSLCIDNAAMIAWTGMEMWDAGWRSDMDITGRRKWPLNALSMEDGSYVCKGRTLRANKFQSQTSI